MLRDLKEPINLYFYFSRDAAAKQSPLVLPYANRVREFLEELAARSGGKIHLHIIDPQPFSDDEDRAAEFGLQSLPAGNGGDALYFGLAGHQLDRWPFRHSELSRPIARNFWNTTSQSSSTIWARRKSR